MHRPDAWGADSVADELDSISMVHAAPRPQSSTVTTDPEIGCDACWLPLAAQEPDTEVLVTMLNAVEEIIAVVGPELLSAEQLAAVFERFKGVFAMSEERRQERALRRSQEDFDEEEAEALQARALIAHINKIGMAA